MKFLWEPAARSDLRHLDRETAMRILLALTRYADSGDGDVKRLTDREGLYRLRVGKWRVFFDRDVPGIARIHGIDNLCAHRAPTHATGKVSLTPKVVPLAAAEAMGEGVHGDLAVLDQGQRVFGC